MTLPLESAPRVRFTKDWLPSPRFDAYAATQSGDYDLRTAGELAVELQDVLTAFGRDVKVPTTSPFTGKVSTADGNPNHCWEHWWAEHNWEGYFE